MTDDQPSTRRSHLYSYHKAKGKLVDFAGYPMPLWYKGIIEEHMAVRNAAGIFDVSHMGRFVIRGSDAHPFLNHVLPTDLSKLQDGGAGYSVLCNEKGGIVDDVVTYRFSQDRFLMVVNAANIDKDYAWLKRHAVGYNVEVEDRTQDIALVSLQGPRSKSIIQGLAGEDLSAFRRFTYRELKICGFDVFVGRTGYTGEDGYEIFIPDCPSSRPEKAEKVWDTILANYGSLGVLPCGLGARDTLRLEAGLCLYGLDIDENTSPLEANYGWLVSLEKGRFIGSEAIMEAKERLQRTRVGLEMEGGGVPRQGCDILVGQETVGKITSGSFSPLLRKGVGMGYVSKHYATAGNKIDVLVRGKRYSAAIKNFPLYDPKVYGWKRGS